jgi:protein tyrosine phosphatase (PTP) superfamily phosphohydrolase (DUF442 family)
MQTIRKINDELAIAGQINPEQFVQLVEGDFRSILNLRSPGEAGFLVDEPDKATALSLHYVNLPFDVDSMSDEAVTRILQQIQILPKPVLVHCDNAIRSAAIALMYIATRQGATLEQAFQQARRLGLFNGVRTGGQLTGKPVFVGSGSGSNEGAGCP